MLKYSATGPTCAGKSPITGTHQMAVHRGSDFSIATRRTSSTTRRCGSGAGAGRGNRLLAGVWSACHLALAGLLLDVVDPVLRDQGFLNAVRASLDAVGVLGSVNLIPGSSEEVSRLWREPGARSGAVAGVAPRKWSFVFIDGDHEAPSPLRDAQICESLLEDDALVRLHDLAAPAAAEGLSAFRSRGWQTLIYQPTQIMGVAWRGNVQPVKHRPDPRGVLAVSTGTPPGLCL